MDLGGGLGHDGVHPAVDGCGAAQNGADAGFEDLAAGGLDDVVVGAGLQAEDDVDVVAARGEHDDRDLLGGADAAADLEAAHVGQHQVEQHQVGAEALQGRQPGPAVGRGLHLVAATAQGEGDTFPYGPVVLDQKHA